MMPAATFRAAILYLFVLAGCTGDSHDLERATSRPLSLTERPSCDAVEFRLDDPYASSVVVSGDFLDPAWPGSASDGALMMSRGLDGVWTVTTSLAAAGPFRYKFIVDGQRWVEDPNNPDRSDDGFGGVNSVFACELPPPCETVTFQLDDAAAYSVAVTGTFVEPPWAATPETGAIALAREGDGIWRTTTRIRIHGTHEYKFVIDGGTRWREDPLNPNTVPDNFGGANSVLEVCAGEPPPQPSSLDPRRSLVVTDAVLLAPFSLEHVLDQIVATAAPGSPDARELFRSMFRVQGSPDCEAGLAGFPTQCRIEATLADVDPFADPATNPNGFLPLALFNRFDLAPLDSAHCGEYRIVFGKRSGQSNGSDRLFMIFEAGLPNPRPELGRAGCRPIVELWASLSGIADPATRAARLVQLYFQGLPEQGVPPVIHADHYGANGLGQIRTNQFMQAPWLLRQFRIVRDGDGHHVLRPAQVSQNPFGPLFVPGSTDPLAVEFRAFFLDQVPLLALAPVGTTPFPADPRFDAGESNSQDVINNYLFQFQQADDGGVFRAQIDGRLAAIGSSLTADQIVSRATTQSCGGCHQLSAFADLGGGVVFPSSLGFVHVGEVATDVGPDGPRFPISPALVDVLLPQRLANLESFLASTPQ